MAHLLGYESCLESLSRDVSDIQAVVTDITSRVGPVRFPSWKYPDKISCEIDIAELLEIYGYSDDEDHCKLSHIVLFELVIDRLVLLLQGTSQYVDQLLKSSERNQRPGSSRVIGSAISVGLVAKKFWNKVVQVQQTTQQIHFETKTKSETLNKMDNTIGDLRDEIKMLKKVIDQKGEGRMVSGKLKSKGKSSMSSAKFILSHNESVSFRSPSPGHDLTLSVEDVAFAKTCQETSTQTYDTAFIPCEACSRTQQHLLEVGNMVMNLCKSQGLKSSLAKQKKLLHKSLVAAADISRWTSEQNQDLARINDHLDNLYAQINPLEAMLKNTQENCKQLEKQVQDLEQTLITEQNEGIEREEDVKTKCKTVVEEKDSLLEEADNANKKLQQEKELLQEMAAKLNETIQKQKRTLLGLEEENTQLKADLEKENTEVKRLQRVDKEMLHMKVELNEVEIRLRETSLGLDKTQAKNRSLMKHEQALQNKHDTLLQRVDELDNECEDLREKLMETEGERDDLQDEVNNKGEENVELNKLLKKNKKRIEEIQDEKKALAENVQELKENYEELFQQLQDSEEKLKLLSEYPALESKSTGTSNVDETNGKDITDVMKDMERQVMANNIRILMLEEQNDKLRKSITLFMSSDQDLVDKTPQDPVSLWKPHESQDTHQDRSIPSRALGIGCYGDSNPTRSSTMLQENASFTIQPRPPQKPRTDSAKSRQQSPSIKLIEKRHSATLSSKLASSRTKQDTRTPDRDDWDMYQPRTVNPDRAKKREPSPSGYVPIDVFVCTGCDKIYESQRDLDIHKSFCYGSITAMS